MAVRKRGKVWWYDFGNHKYRGPITEARTKYEAEQAETKLKRDVFEGKYGKQFGMMSFDEFVRDTYIPWAKANKRTWRNDELITEVLRSEFKGKTIGEISSWLIERYKRERAASITKRGTTRSPASVNMELAVLSRIFALAVDLEQAANNPCRKVRKLRVDNQRNRYLSNDEETALIAQLTDRRRYLRPIVELALNTGMRRGEILSLTWQSVDFVRGVIQVTKTKTGKDRTIPMSLRVKEVLSALQKGCKGQFVFASKRTGKGFVDIKKAFVAACSDAGINDLHFHDLRHTFATRLGDAGCNTTTIAALLGHSNIQMTMRYTHATDESLRSAVECAVTMPSQTAKQPLMRVALNG